MIHRPYPRRIKKTTLNVGPAGVWTSGLPLSRPGHFYYWPNRAAVKWFMIIETFFLSLGETQYRLAFEKAFNLLKGTTSEDAGKPKRKVILFLTDGAPSDDKKAIFQTIRDRNLELNNSVVILTFGFGGVDQETMNILQDIALQNTAKYGVFSNASFGDITVKFLSVLI